MLAKLREAFKTSTAKHMLQTAEIVVHQRGFVSPEPSDMEHPGDVEVALQLVGAAFFHVSLHSWSPYKPTFRALFWPGEKIDDAGRMVLRAEDTYFNANEAAAVFLDGDPELVSMTFYRLADVRKLVADVDPREIVVEPFEDGQQHWLAVKKERKGRHVGEASWLHALDVIDYTPPGDDNSEHEDDGEADPGADIAHRNLAFYRRGWEGIAICCPLPAARCQHCLLPAACCQLCCFACCMLLAACCLLHDASCLPRHAAACSCPLPACCYRSLLLAASRALLVARCLLLAARCLLSAARCLLLCLLLAARDRCQTVTMMISLNRLIRIPLLELGLSPLWRLSQLSAQMVQVFFKTHVY